MKAGKNAIKVLTNSNPIQIRKETVKKRFTDGSLSNFTRFGHDAKRERGLVLKKTQRQLRYYCYYDQVSNKTLLKFGCLHAVFIETQQYKGSRKIITFLVGLVLRSWNGLLLIQSIE